jgi:hypothetical protein
MPPCTATIDYRFQSVSTEKTARFWGLLGVISTQVTDLLNSYKENTIIQDLGSASYEILKSIPVEVQEEDGAFVASFFDANIGITGDTKEEAVENLRFLLTDMFDDLESQESQLGPHPQQQLAVMRSFMRKRL